MNHTPRKYRRIRPSAIIVAVVALIVCAAVAACTPVPAAPTLIVGDSLSFNAQSDIDAMWARHNARATWVGGPGQSPLNRTSTWRADITNAINSSNPQIVVYEACCNYANGSEDELYIDPNTGQPVPRDSARMFQLWEQVVRGDLNAAHARGAKVWLVESPPPVPGSLYALIGFDVRVTKINAIYSKIAGDTPWVKLIRWDTAFTDPNTGKTATSLPCCGVVRAADGLHWDGAGFNRASTTIEGTVYTGA